VDSQQRPAPMHTVLSIASEGFKKAPLCRLQFCPEHRDRTQFLSSLKNDSVQVPVSVRPPSSTSSLSFRRYCFTTIPCTPVRQYLKPCWAPVLPLVRTCRPFKVDELLPSSWKDSGRQGANHHFQITGANKHCSTKRPIPSILVFTHHLHVIT
jgi:hypothetical protein